MIEFWDGLPADELEAHQPAVADRAFDNRAGRVGNMSSKSYCLSSAICWNCLRKKDKGAGIQSRAVRVEICASKYYPSLDGVTRSKLSPARGRTFPAPSAKRRAIRFRDKPSGKPLFLKGLLRTGGVRSAPFCRSFGEGGAKPP